MSDTVKFVSQFVNNHNERQVDKIKGSVVDMGEIEYLGKKKGDVENFFKKYDDTVYWHAEEDSYSLTNENETLSNIKFPIIQYWREDQENSHHKSDHFAYFLYVIQFDNNQNLIQKSWIEEIPDNNLTIREKRKIKRRAIKFHGRRMETITKLKKAKEESDRWRKEGDNVTEEQRNEIRMKKKEEFKKKHAKDELKSQKKQKIQSLVLELENQENEYWKNRKQQPEEWKMPRVCIDMSFLPTMDKFACSSIVNQLGCVYTRNLDALHPFRVYLNSNSEESNERLKTLICKQKGMNRWVGFSTHFDSEVFDLLPSPGLPIVYLSPDAEEPLEFVDDKHLYVIGGICDRDRKKNITKDKCDKLGIVTRRLPISEYISLNGTKILTINCVFSILCSWIETKSWVTALTSNISSRVIVKIKDVPQ